MLQLDRHSSRIANSTKSEVAVKRRRRLVDWVDYKSPCARNRRHLRGIQDGVSQESRTQSHSLEILVDAEHPQQHRRDL